MKSRMSTFVFKCLVIKYFRPKIFFVVLTKSFEHPNKGYFVSSHHIMGDALELPMRFESWMFEKIPIGCGNFVRLADLYWNIIEIVNDRLYSISSINHGKMRLWISFLLHCPKKVPIVFCGFLEDMFRCENIPSDSILCYENSPLCFWTLLSKEGRIKNENRMDVSWQIASYPSSPPFLDENTSSNLLWIVRTEYPVSLDSSKRVCLRTE